MTNSLFTEKQIAMFILSPLKIAEAIYTLGKEIGIQRDISERVSNTFCEQSEFEEYKGKGYIDGYDSRRTFNGNF